MSLETNGEAQFKVASVDLQWSFHMTVLYELLLF